MMGDDRIDNQSPEIFGQTPSQTVGPFFHYGLPWKGGADLISKSDLGARPELFPAEHYVLNDPAPNAPPQGDLIEIVGLVLDGKGDPVPDAMVEIWQANSAGRYSSAADDRAELPLDPNYIGFGRSSTSENGEYRFRTIRPGRVPAPGNSLQAPHIAFSVFGRGLLKRLVTRLYFEDGEGNGSDPVLSLVPESCRSSLISTRDGQGRWRFDIILQGERETVFFEL